MKKYLLFFIIAITFPVLTNAQTEKEINTTVNTFNKYLIKIDTNIIYDIPNTGDFLKMICGANSVTYNPTTKYYEILTIKKLEHGIIGGKLQKNLTPLADFISDGKKTIDPSAQINLISTQ